MPRFNGLTVAPPSIPARPRRPEAPAVVGARDPGPGREVGPDSAQIEPIRGR